MFSFFVVLNGLGENPQKHIYKQNIDHLGAENIAWVESMFMFPI